ncbi:MAG TPA: thioredoxin family protein [Pyrinomonadaceae bacterium]|nr:thioredoxin family protein [Pyrinomonadaceae bacterium]
MKEFFEKAMTFEEYLNKIDELLSQGKTTGEDQSESRVYFGKLNRHRMKRLEKTIKLDEGFVQKIKALKKPLNWLIITEGWCGDGAQNIPAIEKIAEQNQLINTRYLLRDENLDLMDKFLTNGGRAIPILICLDAETFQVLGKWGSRPRAIQEYFLELKASGIEKTERDELIQRRYNSDKEQSIQSDFAELIEGCLQKSLGATA